MHRVLVAPGAGHVHQRRRGQLRHVAHDRDQRVVQLGRHRDRLGAEPATHARTSANTCGSVRVGRREHPGGADEQVGAGPGEALLLRARHRVTADEARRELGARRLDRGDDRRLHRADVGDQRRAGVERLDHDLGDVARPAPRPP